MSTAYFTQALNYTLANEDTRMELSMLPSGVNHLFSVAGSGGRILPLLAKRPKKITCVDVSKEQLYLTELRFESARALSHSDFVAFWGYPPKSASPEQRRELFETIRLSAPARKFFLALFESQHWKSILYLGRWEQTFGKLAKVNQRITGVAGRKLFESLTLQEQVEFLENGFPRRAFNLITFILGNAGIFNTLLYKGHFPAKNIDRSFYRFYSDVLNHLFRQAPARESFFLQLLFFGKVVFAEGCPVECDPMIFPEIKAGLENSEIRYQQGDLLERAASSETPIDFFSFSDVPSYFKGDTESGFVQKVAPRLAPGALVVIRNYLHVPENLRRDGFETVTEQYRTQIDAEKVGVYLVDILRKAS